MTATEELLPCPICGRQPDFQHFNITPNVQGRIVCSCGIELRQGKNDTEDDMRIIWNTRSDYAVQAENERKTEQAIAATLGDADLAAENAKLREELEQWHKLTAGIELPEYPITQFQPKDLERENAKLIEFASAMYRSILLVPDDHIPAETKTRYFETAVSFGLDVPDD